MIYLRNNLIFQINNYRNKSIPTKSNYLVATRNVEYIISVQFGIKSVQHLGSCDHCNTFLY